MKNLFVPYEIALKLKELGFDEPCMAQYYRCPSWYRGEDKKAWMQMMGGPFGNEFQGKKNSVLTSDKAKREGFVMAPLYQQVIDWFREKHDLLLIPDFPFYGCMRVRILERYTLESMPRHYLAHDKYTKMEVSMEKANNEAILEAIKLIEVKK